jgi:hypothetical protein
LSATVSNGAFDADGYSLLKLEQAVLVVLSVHERLRRCLLTAQIIVPIISPGSGTTTKAKSWTQGGGSQADMAAGTPLPQPPAPIESTRQIDELEHPTLIRQAFTVGC